MSRLAPPSSTSLEYREIVRSCRGPAIYRHHRSGCRRIPPRPPQRGPPAVASRASAGPRGANRARPASIAMQRRRPMSTSTASSRPAAAGSARSPAPGPGPAPRAGTSATRSAGRWPRSSSLMCSSATRASRTRRHGLPPGFSGSTSRRYNRGLAITEVRRNGGKHGRTGRAEIGLHGGGSPDRRDAGDLRKQGLRLARSWRREDNCLARTTPIRVAALLSLSAIGLALQPFDATSRNAN